MTIIKSSSAVKRLAGLELNDLLLAGVLPDKVFSDSRVSSGGTRVYDVNGELLFRRVPLKRGRDELGYADIAVNAAVGYPFLAASSGQAWNEKSLIEQAIKAARKKVRRFSYDSVRFVAYSYPKLALQFLQKRREVLMLEVFTWQPVPPLKRRDEKQPPSNFERWSLLEEMPASKLRANVKRFDKRIEQWEQVSPERRAPRRFRPEVLQAREFERVVRDFEIRPLIKQREIHYSPENADHSICYELRGQITNVWCVAASVQMILDFYRYNYTQTRLATELGLGTIASPNGLPYSRDADVVTVLENMTGNALNATMNTSPTWSQFVSEIDANRPLISFVPGHARTVAGYTTTRLTFANRFKGLLVYDPWPPSPSSPVTPMTGGVVTRWENFDATTYRRTFTAEIVLH